METEGLSDLNIIYVPINFRILRAGLDKYAKALAGGMLSFPFLANTDSQITSKLNLIFGRYPFRINETLSKEKEPNPALDKLDSNKKDNDVQLLVVDTLHRKQVYNQEFLKQEAKQSRLAISGKAIEWYE